MVLLHRLEQRRLRLRRGSVDLVREQHVREDRALDEAELALARLLVLLEDVRSGDVGRHEVRRELHALELKDEDLRERRDEERLREARHAHQQHVAAREDRGEHELDDVHLPDDDLREVLLREGELLVEELDEGSAGFGGATTAFFGSSISIFAFTLAPNLILSPDLSPTVVILFPFTYVPLVEPRSCSIQAPFLQQMNA